MKYHPFAGIQPAQQAPVGVPPAVAQYFQQQQLQQAPQQQGQRNGQNPLASFIDDLKQKGATDDQIKDIIQQAQGNGQIPNSDNNSDNSSSLNQALNKMASGEGNVNYDTIQNAYPTPRAPIVQDREHMIYNALANKDMNGESAGMGLANALASVNQQQNAQQNDYQKQLNQRDIGAYGATTGIAEKAAQIAAEKAKNDRLTEYEKERTDIMQQNADAARLKPLGNDAQGNAILYDQKTGKIKTIPNVNLNKGGANNIRKLPVGTQNAINQEIDRQLGILDEKGKKVDEAPNPLLVAQRAQIADDVTKQLQSSVDISVPGAVSRAFDKLGGIDSLQEQTTPRSGITKILGNKSTGYRMFPQVSENAPSQEAPNVVSQGVPDKGDDLTPLKNGLPAPRSQSEYADLPSGTKFLDPNGKIRVKP